jgi:AraC-like DNA-binding protein
LKLAPAWRGGAAMGTSFTAHVNQLRLQRAFTLLIEARDGKGRISDVAL